MQSEFARDLKDQDRPIAEAYADRPGKPLKIRIQPMILTARQYRAWKDVRWTLDCDTPAEAFAVRDAMRLFFEALTSCGPAPVSATLSGLMPARAEDGSSSRKEVA
jgi:hypothetical protein